MKILNILLALMLITSVTFAEQSQPEVTGEPPAKEAEAEENAEIEEKELTKDDILAMLLKTLESVFEGIAGLVPGLKRLTDKKGTPYYVYVVPGEAPVRLEDLDKETLSSLFSRVRQASAIYQAQRIDRQLKIGSDAQRIQGQLRRIPGKPHVPRQAAKTPYIPPSPHRVPNIPTQPKR